MAENEAAKGEQKWVVVIILPHGQRVRLESSRGVLRAFKQDWIVATAKSDDPERTFITCHGELNGQPKELYLRLSDIRGMVLSRVDD